MQGLGTCWEKRAEGCAGERLRPKVWELAEYEVVKAARDVCV